MRQLLTSTLIKPIKTFEFFIQFRGLSLWNVSWYLSSGIQRFNRQNHNYISALAVPGLYYSHKASDVKVIQNILEGFIQQQIALFNTIDNQNNFICLLLRPKFSCLVALMMSQHLWIFLFTQKQIQKTSWSKQAHFLTSYQVKQLKHPLLPTRRYSGKSCFPGLK